MRIESTVKESLLTHNWVMEELVEFSLQPIGIDSSRLKLVSRAATAICARIQLIDEIKTSKKPFH